MDPSGQFKAGRILLLVGAILSAVGALFLTLAGLFLLALSRNIVGGEGDATLPTNLIAIVYFVLGLLGLGGAIVGFQAQAKANRGDARGAWVLGLVAALLPPVQVVTLVGAILCLTSPEHAQQTGKQG